jgi:iron complex transport system substrate-binding protein
VKRRVGIFLLLMLAFSASFAQIRIITAGSAITETVCALGDCDKIIATDETSLYPESVQKLPSIGYRNNIGAEGIISLKPTLIIAEKDYVKDEVLSQLTATGIKVLIIDRVYSVDATKKLITQIAEVLNRQAEGKKVIAQIDADLAEAKTLLKKATTKPTVLGVYNRGSSNISLAGKDTFGEIIAYTGAQNAFDNVTGYKPLNTEALIAANPDFIVTTAYGLESIGGVEGFLKIPGVAQTTAGKKKQIVSVESIMLTNFGPRIGQAIKELVVLLHPELGTIK